MFRNTVRSSTRVGPQSEAESEGDAEEGDADQDDNTYVWFLPDTVPDSEEADEDMDEDDIMGTGIRVGG